jgi:hypothetical protein
MKFVLAAIAAIFFAADVLAKDHLPQFASQGDVVQGVMRGLIEKRTDHFDLYSKDSSFKPNIKNRLILDLNADRNYQATNRRNEFSDTSVNARFFSTFNLSRNFFVNSFLRLQEARQISEAQRRAMTPDGGGNRSFENHGLAFEELVLAFDSKHFAAIAGKFNPNYGVAWRQGRGIWNHQISELYRQQEKLGFSTILRAGSAKKTGEYDFGFSVFTNDRKNLDNSIITKRDSDSKRDAKPGDTRALTSYVTSLDVEFDFAEKEKLTYHFAYMNLAVNERVSQVSQNKIDDQKGFVASMNYKYPLSENFVLDGLVEFNDTRNLNENSDVSEKYLIGSLVTKIYKNWNTTFGYSSLQNIGANAYGFDQNLSEISFGYDFDKTILFDRLTAQLGYRNRRLNYKTSLETENSAGVLLRYYKAF